MKELTTEPIREIIGIAGDVRANGMGNDPGPTMYMPMAQEPDALSHPQGTQIRVTLDGKTYIELSDSHISGAGAVGVWTKADSVTLFDDFSYQAGP